MRRIITSWLAIGTVSVMFGCGSEANNSFMTNNTSGPVQQSFSSAGQVPPPVVQVPPPVVQVPPPVVQVPPPVVQVKSAKGFKEIGRSSIIFAPVSVAGTKLVGNKFFVLCSDGVLKTFNLTDNTTPRLEKSAKLDGINIDIRRVFFSSRFVYVLVGEYLQEKQKCENVMYVYRLDDYRRLCRFEQVGDIAYCGQYFFISGNGKILVYTEIDDGIKEFGNITLPKVDFPYGYSHILEDGGRYYAIQAVYLALTGSTWVGMMIEFTPAGSIVETFTLPNLPTPGGYGGIINLAIVNGILFDNVGYRHWTPTQAVYQYSIAKREVLNNSFISLHNDGQMHNFSSNLWWQLITDYGPMESPYQFKTIATAVKIFDSAGTFSKIIPLPVSGGMVAANEKLWLNIEQRDKQYELVVYQLI
ncbi:MAG: hypothetical protein WCK11_02880 [Candidatus Falkowbacteria bacterium]